MKIVLIALTICVPVLSAQTPGVFTVRNPARVYKSTGAPASADCNYSGHTGRVYVRTDAAAANATLYVCAKTGASTFGWEGPFAPMGSETVGAVLASAGTITPTATIHHISGTAAIATITVPAGFLSGGKLNLIPDGAFTTTTGGNISLASTAVVNRTLVMTWDGTKWNPGY